MYVSSCTHVAVHGSGAEAGFGVVGAADVGTLGCATAGASNNSSIWNVKHVQN